MRGIFSRSLFGPGLGLQSHGSRTVEPADLYF